MQEGGSPGGGVRRAATDEKAAKTSWIVAAALLGLLALWALRSCGDGGGRSTPLKQAMQALAANPAEFVKSRITGGVGVLLGIDSATGLPKVMGVVNGSPADQAGLRKRDVITQVNGVTTTGQKLAAVVEAIKGFSLGSVEITVLRGETNRTRLEFVIRRHSMNALLQPTNTYH